MPASGSMVSLLGNMVSRKFQELHFKEKADRQWETLLWAGSQFFPTNIIFLTKHFKHRLKGAGDPCIESPEWTTGGDCKLPPQPQLNRVAFALEMDQIIFWLYHCCLFSYPTTLHYLWAHSVAPYNSPRALFRRTSLQMGSSLSSSFRTEWFPSANMGRNETGGKEESTIFGSLLLLKYQQLLFSSIPQKYIFHLNPLINLQKPKA